MTQPDELVAWYRAQLDEDEQWALAASAPYPYAAGSPTVPPGGLHWEWVTGEEWVAITPDPVVSEYVADGDPVRLASRETWPSSTRPDDPRWQMRRTYGEDVQEMDAGAAGHIVRHDPARVLREVEAKRQLIDLHQPGDFPDCRGCGDPHPCATAKLLALPYADRPGYREEWRP